MAPIHAAAARPLIEFLAEVPDPRQNNRSHQALLAVWRGHRGIETRLPSGRDVTLGEEACRVRTGVAPQALAAVRNPVISLVRLAGGTNVAAALRRFAAKPAEALAAIGVTYPLN